MTGYDEWRARYPEAAEALQRIVTHVEVDPSDKSSEARVQAEVMLEAVKYGGAAWRNNAGALPDPRTGREVRFGLNNTSKKFWHNWSSGDTCGPIPMLIQPHHVGRRIGVFGMWEIKRSGWKKPRDQHEIAQMNALTHVRAMGGIGAFCQSVGDFRASVDLFIA